MKSFLFRSAAFLLLACAALSMSASDNDEDREYRPVRKSLQVSFNYSKFNQSSTPEIHSDISFSLTTYKSYYLYKTKTKRFTIGIDCSWGDLNYSNYKVNVRVFEGSTVHYEMHQGDVGLQVGVGMNFGITRDLNLHFRALYNPAFSMLYANSTFRGGFAQYGVCGLTLSWKHIGLGIDVRYGRAKFKSIGSLEDFIDEEEGTDYSYGRYIAIPGTSPDGSKIEVDLFSLRSSIIFTF